MKRLPSNPLARLTLQKQFEIRSPESQVIWGLNQRNGLEYHENLGERGPGSQRTRNIRVVPK